MKHNSYLIKPASSLCNMNCHYCFYSDVAKHRSIYSKGFMNEETTDILIKNALADSNEITFAFQGGEPTLAGLTYFYHFVDTVNRLKKHHTIHYTIQTNGLLLNDEWLNFFKKNKFLVGISLDGIKIIHDSIRTQNHNGTFNRVFSVINNMKRKNISFNILTVLTPKLVPYAKEVYQFYKDNNFDYVQFIPCLSELDCEKNEYSLSPKQFCQFYKDIFQIWYKDLQTKNALHITLFDNLLMIFHGIYPSTCGLLGQCQIQMIIEADGSTYPCDFYAYDKYKLGNIKTHSFQEMRSNQIAIHFLKERKKTTLLCDNCKFINICKGGCKRMNTAYFDNDFCGYQSFLEKTYKQFYDLSKICTFDSF